MSLRKFVRRLLGTADTADEHDDTDTGGEPADRSADGGETETATSTSTGSTPADDVRAPDPTAPPTELTDENRVLRLLIEGDGSVTVETLRERTGWDGDRAESVVAEMEEDGQVRLLERGSKTLVCRPGFEPDGHNRLFRS